MNHFRLAYSTKIKLLAVPKRENGAPDYFEKDETKGERNENFDAVSFLK